MKLSTVDTKGYDPGEARTHDLHPVKVALSLLSYGRNVDLKAFSWVYINRILLKKQWLL
ncbi:hypothetical protein [Bacillus toyonensis]|uniref:hypothetical protein n=1 Tax=Bacillus toyonensis TaxID=155322 RepID=UPI002E22D965|nr:hypothetical protein [Bacillus toyonensis]